MPNLSIKDVPEAWAESLRQRAANNHRSLQGELLAMIETFVKDTKNSPQITPTVAGSEKPSRQRVEQIYAKHLLQFPKPLRDQAGMTSAQLIRQDREQR